MHFKNARNASVYAVFRAFFTQSLAKLRINVQSVKPLSISRISDKSPGLLPEDPVAGNMS